jgi:hypothetical protein
MGRTPRHGAASSNDRFAVSIAQRGWPSSDFSSPSLAKRGKVGMGASKIAELTYRKREDTPTLTLGNCSRRDSTSCIHAVVPRYRKGGNETSIKKAGLIDRLFILYN